MDLKLTKIIKINDNSSNDICCKHWQIAGEISLYKDDLITIDYWTAQGGNGPKFYSNDKNTSANIQLNSSDKAIINIEATSSYNKIIPADEREFTIEIYYRNHNHRRKSIFTYNINNNDQFIPKDHRLHLFE